MSGNREFKIDLSFHQNPEDFLRRCQEEYPFDEKVQLLLQDKKLIIRTDDDMDTQSTIAVCSTINNRVYYEMREASRTSHCLHPN